MKRHPKSVAMLCFAVAVLGFVDSRREPKVQKDLYQVVRGTVASTTVTVESGGDTGKIKLWLADYPDVSFDLYQMLPMRRLSDYEGQAGSKVEMLCPIDNLKSPDKGLFHNLKPFINVVSLTVDGRPIYTWDDFAKYQGGGGKTTLYGCFAFVGLGMLMYLLGIYMDNRASRQGYRR